LFRRRRANRNHWRWKRWEISRTKGFQTYHFSVLTLVFVVGFEFLPIKRKREVCILNNNGPSMYHDKHVAFKNNALGAGCGAAQL
jgi:hypothetical protein